MRTGIRLILCTGMLWTASLPAQTDDVVVARERWRAADASTYEYGYHKYCECHGDTPPETLVTVVAGTVTNVRHRPANSDRIVSAAERNFQYYWTIDGLFDLIESAVARDATVRARFDPVLGYPTSVFIDYVQNTIGDEVDVRITQLRLL